MHPPAAVRPAAEVDGVELQPATAGGRGAADGADEVRRAGDHRRRQGPFADHAGLAIEVGQQGLHQPGALGDAGGERRPFLGTDDQRRLAERPGTLRILAPDAVGDAGIADVAHGEIEAGGYFAFRVLSQIAEELEPVGPRPAGAVEELIGHAGERPIAAKPAGEARRALRIEIAPPPLLMLSAHRAPCIAGWSACVHGERACEPRLGEGARFDGAAMRTAGQGSAIRYSHGWTRMAPRAQEWTCVSRDLREASVKISVVHPC